MVTLISSTSSDGKHRVCCDICYNAKGPTCTCVCQGLNHGVGLDQAIQNTKELGDELITLLTEVKEQDESNQENNQS